MVHLVSTVQLLVSEMEEATEKEYLVGEPVPIEELKIVRVAKYPWLKIFRAIAEGQAQEVRVSYTSCKRAIENLVNEGKFKKGEFEVRSKTGKDRRKVYILHHGAKRK